MLPVAAASVSAADGFNARLEAALNSGEGASALETLVVPSLLPDLTARFDRFRTTFPDARWTVRSMAPGITGHQTLELLVRGERSADGLTYRLEASQRLMVRIEAGRLQEQELLSDQSLLRSGTAHLPITLEIPDEVLTGSRYDVDVIFDKPLGHAIVAGGLLSLTPKQVTQQISPRLALEPLGGGGLFKTVQAPQRPGSQHWAAMLVHPDGVVTVSKRVRVVSDRRGLAQ